jgi:hypothetical protein
MSTPPNTGATDLGITRKLFERRSGGRPMRDLTNTGEVFALAAEIADGNTRRLSLLSIEETRAIAQLAAAGGVLLHCAIELVHASDTAAEPRLVRAHLEALCKATRALITKEGEKPT